MSEDQSVFAAALELPPPARAELAELLWASLPDEPTEEPLDESVKAAWLTEANRRMHEVASGEVKLIPGEAVMARFRGK